MADRNVKVTVRADVADFKRGMDEAAKSTERVGTAAQATAAKAKTGLSGLAQSARDNREAWTSTGTALVGVGAAMTGLGAVVLKTGISYNTLRQTSVAALTTLLGSAEKANVQMDKLDAFASTSPFARDVFIKAQQQLIGFGMEAERVVPTLDAIQNAVAATGGSNQDIAELTRIIAQVGAAGKITAVDLMQFGQRGVDAATLIGSQMGKTGAQIREEITDGTLGADEAIQALVAGMDQRFGGAAANVKNTFAGAVDRVKAAFRDLSAEMASFLVNADGGGLAVDGLNWIADLLRMVQELPGPLKLAVGAMTGLTGGMALFGGAAMLAVPRLVDFYDNLGRLGKVGAGAQGAIKSVATALTGPWGLALAGAVIAGGIFIEAQRRKRAAINEVKATLDEQTGAITENTREWAVNMAATEGALDWADDLGLRHGVVVDALMGDAAALREVAAAAEESSMAAVQNADAWTGTSREYAATADSGRRLMDFLSAKTGIVTEAAAAHARERAEMEGTERIVRPLGAGMWELAQAAAAYRDTEVDKAAERQAEAVAQAKEAYDGLLGSIRALNDSMLAQQDAQIGFYAALDSATAALENNKRTLDVTVEAGRANRTELLRLAGATGEYAAQTFDLTGSLSQAEAIIWQGREAFIESAIAMGATKEEAGRLADQYGLIPEDIATEIMLSGVDHSISEAEGMVEEIEGMEAVASMNLDSKEARMEHERVLGIMNDSFATSALLGDATEYNKEREAALRRTREAVATSKIDGNSMPFMGVANMALTWASRQTATSKLDADRSRADGKVSSWRAWASGLWATANVDARTSPASSTVNGLIGWINNRWATVNVTARMRGALDAGAGLGFSGRRASGGIERRPMMMGPGYGPTNVILAGEPETRGEAFISNHPRYRRENEQYLRVAASWFDMDVVKKYAAGNVAQRFASPAPVYSLPVQGRVSDAPVTHDYSITIGTVVNPQAEPATRTAQRQRQRYAMRGRG